jgi:hypothetical protein
MNNLLVSVQVLITALCLTSGLKNHSPFLLNPVVNMHEVPRLTYYSSSLKKDLFTYTSPVNFIRETSELKLCCNLHRRQSPGWEVKLLSQA